MRVNVGLYIDDDGVPSQGVYGKYKAEGYTDAGFPNIPSLFHFGHTDMMTLFPKCLHSDVSVAGCRPEQVVGMPK